ncbi:hypothetical protein [Flavobacterium sp. UBA7682]|uniref:hypothetical protein n=1 Tax=Flavobacterium sp. UBA7682 TaxID=1946560 RepID=UPI0025C4F9E3|nr:hypothetical protein [Flavobacterium sp. UBA7682]
MKPFKLDNEPKITSGFTTPEGYFDSFNAKILRQLPSEKPKVISIFSRKKTWYYTAAAVVVMMLSIPVFNTFKTSPEEIDAIALEDYLNNHTTISNDEIANFLDKEDLDKMKLELNLQDEAMEEILLNNADLEQYLID